MNNIIRFSQQKYISLYQQHYQAFQSHYSYYFKCRIVHRGSCPKTSVFWTALISEAVTYIPICRTNIRRLQAGLKTLDVGYLMISPAAYKIASSLIRIWCTNNFKYMIVFFINKSIKWKQEAAFINFY